MQTEKLPRQLINELLHHAQTYPEQEVCGLVGCKENKTFSFYRIQNAAANPVSRFQLDSKQHIESFRKMREKGEELFAIFHSHPNSPAEPSAADQAEAAYTDALYLIASLSTKGILTLRGFRLSPEITEVMLTLKED